MIKQPIETARGRSDVVLTDQGTAKFLDAHRHGSPIDTGWYLCDALGEIPTCAEDGTAISRIHPTFWVEFDQFND